MKALSLPIPEQFNVAQFFVERHVREGRGDSLALLFEDRQFTYRQIAEQVNRAANLFARSGVKKRERILLLARDSPSWVAAFWGGIKLGAVVVPLNTLLTPDDYAFMLRDSSARGLIVEDVLLEKVAPILSTSRRRKLVWVAGQAPEGYRTFEGELARHSPDFTAAVTRRDAPAFWLYTSGSTGQPKAAIHCHQDMTVCLERFARQVLQISASDRTFSTSKLFFAYGLGNGLYFSFGVGGSSVLLAERPTPERVFSILRRHRPTLFFAVPAVYSALLQAPEADVDAFRTVRCAVSAGEALPAMLWENFRGRFGISILDGIGSTEMLHMFISNRLEDMRPGRSGMLVPGYDAKIVDEDDREVAPGETGNLLVRGESGARAYWRRPELTRQTFRKGWIFTGDRYSRDARGYFLHHGRSDDMLKVSGMWVSPLEVENALLAHRAVMDCAVVGVADRQGLTKPKAFVVLKNPASASQELAEELAQFLKTRLASYKLPREIAFLESLPRTATGKIQRYKLRAGYLP